MVAVAAILRCLIMSRKGYHLKFLLYCGLPCGSEDSC